LEANIRNFKRDTKKVGLVLVERSAPTKTEKEMAGRAGAGNVEAPAPNDTERKKKERKQQR
jgi:hypothetical protein